VLLKTSQPQPSKCPQAESRTTNCHLCSAQSCQSFSQQSATSFPTSSPLYQLSGAAHLPPSHLFHGRRAMACKSKVSPPSSSESINGSFGVNLVWVRFIGRGSGEPFGVIGGHCRSSEDGNTGNLCWIALSISRRRVFAMEAFVDEVPESRPQINLNQNPPSRPVASTGPSFPALPRQEKLVTPKSTPMTRLHHGHVKHSPFA